MWFSWLPQVFGRFQLSFIFVSIFVINHKNHKNHRTTIKTIFKIQSNQKNIFVVIFLRSNKLRVYHYFRRSSSFLVFTCFTKKKFNAFCNSISYFPFFRSHNERAHLAWVVTRPVRQTARNRLKIGARREGTVSDDILETRRLPRTDG